MQIKGYAAASHEEETILKYPDRYQEIRHLAESLNIKRTPEYAHTRFTGELTTPEAKALSELDLALIADRGNLCFGATCTKSNDRFSGSYNTD